MSNLGTRENPLRAAIVGSGPAGFYAAEALIESGPTLLVDMFERLASPFGLVRSGVAPDHPKLKQPILVYQQIAESPQFRFLGNVTVGRDVSVPELKDCYHVVVFACGAQTDRAMGIGGEYLPGSRAATEFVGWYNGHPDHRAPAIDGVRSALIIGNGNVAIDVARVLAKSSTELAGSDLSADVMSWLEAQPIESIHIVGRRSAADAKFTQHELAELGTLQRAVPTVMDPASVFGNGAIVETLRTFTKNQSRSAQVTICFHFNLTPIGFLGNERLSAVQFRSANGAVTEIPAQLAVTCIGYETRACCTANPANGVFTNEEGKVEDRLYVVGWAKRGPSGTIPTNRAEAQQVAQKIAQEVPDSVRPGRAGVLPLLEQRQVCWVDYAAWRRIDAAELARAGGERCRGKLTTVTGMLKAAQVDQSLSCPSAIT